MAQTGYPTPPIDGCTQLFHCRDTADGLKVQRSLTLHLTDTKEQQSCEIPDEVIANAIPDECRKSLQDALNERSPQQALCQKVSHSFSVLPQRQLRCMAQQSGVFRPKTRLSKIESCKKIHQEEEPNSDVNQAVTNDEELGLANISNDVSNAANSEYQQTDLNSEHKAPTLVESPAEATELHEMSGSGFGNLFSLHDSQQELSTSCNADSQLKGQSLLPDKPLELDPGPVFIQFTCLIDLTSYPSSFQ